MKTKLKKGDNVVIIAGKDKGKEGKITKIATDHAISMVRTSSLGSTAVWMDNGSKDYIAIYDASGNKAVDMMIEQFSNIETFKNKL